jgi:hypothetical protein
MQEQQKKSKKGWWLAGGIFVVLAVASGGNDRRSTGSNFHPYSSSSRSISGDAPVSPPPGIKMDARERAIYSSDPSSMGYTDSDRDFLRQHGVSESEARAAESVLRGQGVN